MNKILHTLWQINYNRDPKENVSLVIRQVSPKNDIAGEIRWGIGELRFSTTSECQYLLDNRFKKGILLPFNPLTSTE